MCPVVVVWYGVVYKVERLRQKEEGRSSSGGRSKRHVQQKRCRVGKRSITEVSLATKTNEGKVRTAYCIAGPLNRKNAHNTSSSSSLFCEYRCVLLMRTDSSNALCSWLLKRIDITLIPLPRSVSPPRQP